jgi:hypothetical protein
MRNRQRAKMKKREDGPKLNNAPDQPDSQVPAAREKGLVDGSGEKCETESPPRLRPVNKHKEFLGVEPLEAEEKAFREKLTRATGITDFDFSVKLLNQIVAVFSSDEPSVRVDCLNIGAAFLYEIKPEDPIEGMLAVQMLGTHNLATEFLRRAALKEQSVEGISENVNRATKLLRTYAAQMEALTRYRAKGQQKVVVEHVSVNAGGQAIVGLVEGGGGVARKSEGRPHAFPICGARTREGHPCKNPPMPNGRCRMHGGKSTGPRTAEGLERIREANLRTGIILLRREGNAVSSESCYAGVGKR